MPGGAGTEANCKLQGVNVGELRVRRCLPTYHTWERRGLCSRPRPCTFTANMLIPGSLELYQGNWGAWCGQAPYGLGTSLAGEIAMRRVHASVSLSTYTTFYPARYRLGIIYNNENDCISIDAAFGIGGDCLFVSPNPGIPYPSYCPSAGQYAACCCVLGNCYNRWGYFSVWVLADAPPSCAAVSGAARRSWQREPCKDAPPACCCCCCRCRCRGTTARLLTARRLSRSSTSAPPASTAPRSPRPIRRRRAAAATGAAPARRRPRAPASAAR